MSFKIHLRSKTKCLTAGLTSKLKFECWIWPHSPLSRLRFKRKRHIYTKVQVWFAPITALYPSHIWCSSVHTLGSVAVGISPTEKRAVNIAKYSITQLCFAQLYWNLICRCIMGLRKLGNCEKKHFRSNPKWRTAPKLEIGIFFGIVLAFW